MSVNLANVKVNKSVVNERITLTKGTNEYQVNHSEDHQNLGQLSYVKTEKAWLFSLPGDRNWLLAGETAKTIADKVLAIWDAELEARDEMIAEAEATPAPSTELVLRPKAEVATRQPEAVTAPAPQPADEPAGEATTLDWKVDTRGGHGPHRAAAIAKIFEAAGAATKITLEKGARYREDVIMVHALAEPAIIERLEDVLDAMIGSMETRAAIACREASRRAKAEGLHHSHHGAHARRGYLRGFGAGVADVLSAAEEWSTVDDEEATAQMFNKEEWLNGHAAGVVLMEGLVKEWEVLASIGG